MIEERLDLLCGLVHVRAGPGIPRLIDLLHIDHQNRVFFSHVFLPYLIIDISAIMFCNYSIFLR